VGVFFQEYGIEAEAYSCCRGGALPSRRFVQINHANQRVKCFMRNKLIVIVDRFNSYCRHHYFIGQQIYNSKGGSNSSMEAIVENGK
jgi:hypothetical protein